MGRTNSSEQSATRDVVYIFGLLTLAWAATSCASASTHETCARAESWNTFGSYEECMAAEGDPSRAPAVAAVQSADPRSTGAVRSRERRSALQRK